MHIKNITNSFNLEAQIVTAPQIEITKQLGCGIIEFNYKGCPFIFDTSNLYFVEDVRKAICVLEEIHPTDQKLYFANYTDEEIKNEYSSFVYKNEISESSAKDLIKSFTEYWNFNDETPEYKESEIKIFAFWNNENSKAEFSLVKPNTEFYKEMAFNFGYDAHYLFYSLCRIALKFDFDGQSLVANIEGHSHNVFLCHKEVAITKSQINIVTHNQLNDNYTDFDFSFTAFVMQDKTTFKFGNFQFDLDMLPF